MGIFTPVRSIHVFKIYSYRIFCTHWSLCSLYVTSAFGNKPKLRIKIQPRNITAGIYLNWLQIEIYSCKGNHVA